MAMSRTASIPFAGSITWPPRSTRSYCCAVAKAAKHKASASIRIAQHHIEAAPLGHLFAVLREWEARADGQHQIVITALRSAVEPDGGVQANEKCIALTRRIASFVSVGAAARHHVAVSAQDVVDLLRHFVMMGNVRAAGREIHNEEADHLARRRQPVALARGCAHQKFE